MNGENAKMLRRLKKATKVGKREFNSFTQSQRAEVKADYRERSKQVRLDYTQMKKDKKREQISNS